MSTRQILWASLVVVCLFSTSILWFSWYRLSLRNHRAPITEHVKRLIRTRIVRCGESAALKKNHSEIPKIIYQTYIPSSEDLLPTAMRKAMNSFKTLNANYTHKYFGDYEALQILIDNFGNDSDEVFAFRNLIPGAFKIDFWRYAMLWLFGGFYADADMMLLEPFEKWISPNSTFVIPLEKIGFGFHNGFIGSVPKHPILRIAMDMVIYNVKNKFYPSVPHKIVQTGHMDLAVSGPILLGKVINRFVNEPEEVPHNIPKLLSQHVQLIGYCLQDNNEEQAYYTNSFEACDGTNFTKLAQVKYPDFVEEHKSSSTQRSYGHVNFQLFPQDEEDVLLDCGDGLIPFLNFNSIPKIIHQTFKPESEEELATEMRKAMQTMKNLNRNYEHRYYGNKAALRILTDYFGADSDEVFAFENLMPAAFKMDFWRYAVLWLYGGFYADADLILMEPFDQWVHANATFVIPVELAQPLFGLNVALIGSVPRHPLLRIAMDLIIYNVKNKYYPSVPRRLEKRNWILSVFAVTGSVLMGKAFNRFMNEPEEVPHNLALAQQLNFQFLGFCKTSTRNVDQFFTTIPFPENITICKGDKVAQFRYEGYFNDRPQGGLPFTTLYRLKKVYKN
ncbi:hypothetical protein C9374_000701 [Naegleria lovaniensis]|uniref:Glycosyltransferase n=1 Tax=Naegleria lovaniensis TaxID=51637 RepID=A0AA88GTD5_NAELO|nr:uncharacterized protein C9374_000701 [Naegleria lovaniensis]KAG2388537.1 hypothetical protein C9374_000701 [Naegleria lovaniensis]